MTNPRPEVYDDDVEARARQMAGWILELTAKRPEAFEAVERCVRTLVREERRTQLLTRLARLDEKDVATVAALVSQLEQHEREEQPR